MLEEVVDLVADERDALLPAEVDERLVGGVVDGRASRVVGEVGD